MSVIIPCYLDSATLGRAIRSVLAQTYSPIEIIVVNDQSPETVEINQCLSEFPEVRSYVNPLNVGLSATRNNGIAVARGEIVAFLDADDEYHPEKVARQVEALAPGIAVTCGVVNIYFDGRTSSAVRADRVVDSASLIQYRNTLNGAGLLAEKSLLLRLGGFDSTLRSCEDFDLWLRLLSSGIKIKDIGDPLYKYYYNPEGLSKNYKNISKWEIEVIRRHANRMGPKWQKTWRYMSVVGVFLLRHLFRAELSRDKELRNQVVIELNLLQNFPIIRALFLVLVYSRLIYVPAVVLRKLLV